MGVDLAYVFAHNSAMFNTIVQMKGTGVVVATHYKSSLNKTDMGFITFLPHLSYRLPQANLCLGIICIPLVIFLFCLLD